MASGKIQPDGTFVMTTYDEGDGVQVGTHPVIVNELPPDEFSPVRRTARCDSNALHKRGHIGIDSGREAGRGQFFGAQSHHEPAAGK